MKILVFNWSPASSNAGGGVGVYTANLVRQLVEEGHEVVRLSSGYHYDLVLSGPYLRVSAASDEGKEQHVDIVNSPIIAPSYLMFTAIELVTTCDSVRRCVAQCLRDLGPFDVFHIQNVEGIGFDCLSLKNEFPLTRFVLTNHNYHVVCQQVNLWRRDMAECTDFRGGVDCISCNVFPANAEAVVASRIAERWTATRRAPARLVNHLQPVLGRYLARARSWRKAAFFKSADRPTDGPAPSFGPADAFTKRRVEAVTAVNTFVDAVLCVSQEVANVIKSYGVESRKLAVSYIGTSHFKGDIKPRAQGRADRPLHMCFLGYTRPDKGFHFLVDACEAMPAQLRRKISLTFAGAVSDRSALDRLAAIRDRFASLTIREGYAHEDLDLILQTVDLGLVLPLWRDALPQVAIEFVANGVPILSSDRGGQKELANHPAYIFAAGNIDQFWDRISTLLGAENLAFWDVPRPLRSMPQHVHELVTRHYSGQSSTYNEAEPSQDTASSKPSAVEIAGHLRCAARAS